MKKGLFISILFFVFISTSAFGADTIKLTNGEWPPYLSEKMKHHGYTSHVVDTIFKSQGVDVKYGFFPWKRAYVLAEEGKKWNGSVVWSFKEERAKSFLYTEPVIELRGVFFHRKDKPFKWSKWEDLKGLRIGTTRGYTYGPEFDAAVKKGIFKVDEAASDEQGLKKLLAGRIDAMTCEFEVGYTLLNKNFPKEKVSLVTNNSKPYRVTLYHVIISKMAPNAQKMVDLFNKGLAEFKSSGKMAEMEKSFVAGDYN